ncbi:MAG: ATP-binding cassette domain-containing protein [Deltaproteobacteria bacterium]|nr:ATP-binding cassette domain-containing protein [Deltaproteobacteria bacterium]MBW2120423.1 ATP-binding cassette domain-containing protein [Deltaproteobacteria bacterium]
MQTETTSLLDVRGLSKAFPLRRSSLFGPRQYLKALTGVDLWVMPQETLGLVGESGCGKSTLARCILRLIEPTSGTIRFEGQDITHLQGSRLRMLRRNMQIIFQDPYSSLDPRMKVAQIVAEPLDYFPELAPKSRKDRVLYLLEKVGLNPGHGDQYPHQFSGGQRQRIGIARALALNPKLIIADEPVSALDVSVRAQVLNLMEDLKGEFGLTYILIAHDLAVVEHMCDRVAVMYLGRIVETARVDDLYGHPLHPYTRTLLAAIPNPDPLSPKPQCTVTGEVPSPLNPPGGCPFHPRCRERMDRCLTEVPQLRQVGDHHLVACHL